MAVPTATPVTVPVLFTLAMAALLVVQVPPVAVLVNVRVEPGQSGAAPLMVPASGKALTVTAAVALAVPQLLVTE